LDTDKDQHFFYWFFESRSKPSTDPLILWLSGGPGCSSMAGLLMENGPCKVDASTNDTENNPFSWNNNANIVYLDQPINTGFSYGQNAANDTAEVGVQVYAFLQLFFQKFPKYSNNEFHVIGESYGGHYVPDVGKVINDNNKKSGSNKINLNSIGIGNGWTNPLIQYEYYPDMACNNTYYPVLPQSSCDASRKKWPQCKSKIEDCYRNGTIDSCKAADDYCGDVMQGAFFNTTLNPYDIRKNCDNSSVVCYGISNNLEYYLNRKDIKQALGANADINFQICSDTVTNAFNHTDDSVLNFSQYVGELLNDGIRVLIYAGDADYICNWMGNKAWTKALNWTGQAGFNSAKDLPWNPDPITESLGESRTYKNFTFLRVFGSGHMVPFDQPVSALHMVDTWIKGKPFKT
jgi:cathepsin A (carboxypeptidase C)